MNQARRVKGQGMTEYIIIVALIAIGAIVTVGLFSNALRGQVAQIATNVAGDTGSAGMDAAQTAASKAVDKSQKETGLGNYNPDAQQ